MLVRPESSDDKIIGMSIDWANTVELLLHWQSAYLDTISVLIGGVKSTSSYARTQLHLYSWLSYAAKDCLSVAR
jgi:hypothetical protein